MNDDPKPADEPKLVVDTDWKEQVAKEKEQAASLGKAADTKAADTKAIDHKAAETKPAAAASGSELPPPPPASFEVLISLLFTQAMGTLGHVPHPVSGEVEVNKPYARHYIDTLEMLGEKTKGNLTEDESKMLAEALHALRMAYVNTKA